MLQDRARDQQYKMNAQGDFVYDIEVGMLEIYNDEGKCCCRDPSTPGTLFSPTNVNVSPVQILQYMISSIQTF